MKVYVLMNVIVSLTISFTICSLFMYWYEKKLDAEIHDFVNELMKISIQAIEDVKSRKH